MDLPNFLNYLQNFERDRRRNLELFDKAKNNINNAMKNQSIEEIDIFGLAEKCFQSCFGMPKIIARDLLTELHTLTYYSPGADLHTMSCIPFNIRVLATLSYLVHGHLEQFMSLPYDSLRNYSKFKWMRCVAHVCETIVLFLTPKLVKFPSTEEQLCINKLSFLQKFGLPGVVGVLDCFYVRLLNVPESQRKLYRNRHGQTAINVQVICDHNYCFLDVNARFSGVTADIYIWNHSHIHHIVDNLYKRDEKTWLVADRGYRLEGFLMNPYRNAITAEQKSLNVTFMNVRSVLDKAIAILKGRFSCLKIELPFKHQQCTHIITACVTLHNYLLSKKYPIEENITYSIPKRLDLQNARYEDISHDGNLNRKFLAYVQHHNSWQSFKSQYLSTR